MTRFTRSYGEKRKQGQKPKPEKTAFGREIAQLAVREAHGVAMLTPILGRDLTQRLFKAYALADHETACREPIKPGKRRVSWRASYHDDSGDTGGFARFAAFFLKLVERVHLESGVTCGKRTWLGRAHAYGEYVPIGHQGGLSSALATTVRTLQRYESILVAAEVYAIHQPRKKGALAPDDLPAWMRGKKYAYNLYRLKVAIPKPLRERLMSWYRKHGDSSKSPPKTANFEPARERIDPLVLPPDLERADAAQAVVEALKKRPAQAAN